jgi:hypothetical protein
MHSDQNAIMGAPHLTAPWFTLLFSRLITSTSLVSTFSLDARPQRPEGNSKVRACHIHQHRKRQKIND